MKYDFLDVLKITMVFGAGYMLKSLFVTLGNTQENLIVNLFLFLGCVACFILAVVLDDE